MKNKLKEKITTISVRLTEQEALLIRAHAELQRRNVSDLIREKITDYITLSIAN